MAKSKIGKTIWDVFCSVLRFFFVGETGKFSYTAAFAGYGIYVIHLTVISWKETGTLDPVWAEWTVWVIPFLLGLRPAQKILSGGSPIGSFVSRYLIKEAKGPELPNPKEKMGSGQPAPAITAKTNSEKFVAKMFPYAKKIEKREGIDHVFLIAQPALESGWGRSGIGYGKHNLSGIKAGSSWKGDKVLVRTKEVLKTDKAKFPVIHSITKNDKGMYVYDVETYFRSYPTFEGWLEDYIKILQQKHFSHAWPHRGNARKFVAALQSGKRTYATATNYVATMTKMFETVERIIKKLKL